MAERYQKIRQGIAEGTAPTRLALQAGASLFVESPANPTVRRKVLYDELASTPVTEPLNREGDLYGKFLSVLDKRNIQVGTILEEKSPYWDTDGAKYNMLEVVGTSAQFTDHHNAPLPKTTLPPREHLEAFIDRVLTNPEPVTVDQQFDMLLDVTGNNIIGAANLGMLATRYMARFADNRAYPALTVEGKEYTESTPDSEIDDVIRKWNSKTAKFETYTRDTDKNDGIGDGYYFWSHLFGALTLNSNGAKEKAMGKVFERGTEFMIFAKYTVARRKGAILPHFESSQLGKAIGLGLVEQAKEDAKAQS